MINEITHPEIESHVQPQRTINVVYLDDDPLDHKIMGLYIKRSQDAARYNLRCVSSIEETRLALSEIDVDVLVLDNQMPCSDNFRSTLEKLQPIGEGLKVIVTSSDIDSLEFQNLEELNGKPDVVIEKMELRGAINNGLFHG